MIRERQSVHVVTTERQYKGRTYRTHLLRRSFREDGQVKKETVANITVLGDEIVDVLRRALRGEKLVALEELLAPTASRAHGHVRAVLRAMERLGFAKLLSPRSCRERDIIVGVVVARVLAAQSKLATTRWWQTTTLPTLLGLEDVGEDDVYDAMTWLVSEQAAMQKRLAARHLANDGMVLYDLSSSYFEGHCCPLAARGHSRDGKRDRAQVNYGVLTDARGCPVAVDVFKGNTGDPTTLLPQVDRLREAFGLERFVLVGDRGMITQKQVRALREHEGLDWITALRSASIRKLVDDGAVQLSLFDERDLFEVTHPDFPGERLVACRNPLLAERRARKREALLEATAERLEAVRTAVTAGRLKREEAIGLRVGKVVDRHKVGKHFRLRIEEGLFEFSRDEQRIAAEAALDGLYVVRTSVPVERLATEDVVRSYKSLSGVERAFRSFKTIDLKVRPIFHRKEERVRAHIFLCMLAYYVQWHMTEAWRPLLMSDEDLEAKTTRDPVKPARRSDAALSKIAVRRLADGSVVHSFRTLLASLSTIVRNTCRRPDAGPDEPAITVDTIPDPQQRRAFDLLEQIAL